MKISYNWLKEYISVKESPQKLADILTKSGSEVKAIDKTGGDSVMDIEITPNRSDCLSYVGIAREVSAMTGRPVKMPPLKVKEKKLSGKSLFTLEIKDKDLCPKYTARMIRNVKVSDSPEWLKKKITAMGLRPVNNIVDITNFVLFELGQPMHAFDYDKIKGNSIIVRRAKPGEKITSIDNVERKLEKDMLVIADSERPIAIGGVMGGLDTEVTESTKNILLESAYFNPVSVRRTSFKMALMSESSYRFERSVDPETVLGASNRAAFLIKDICGGEIGELIDKGKNPYGEKTIMLRMRQLNKILNLDLKEAYVKRVLSRLGLKTSSKKGAIKASVPSFRQDIRYEVDLIEEISRIYGYENITTTIPRIVPNPERKATSWRAKEKAVETLISSGLSEIITYAMTSKSSIQKVCGLDLTDIVTVKNYISVDQEVMRPSLVPGVLSVLSYNTNRGIRDLKVFEIGGAYRKDSKEGYSEKTYICIALTGTFFGDWQRQESDATYFDLKGVLEELFRNLGFKNFTLSKKEASFLAEGEATEIFYAGNSVGKLGLLTHNVAEAFDLKAKVYIAEIDFDSLLPFVNLDKKFTGIPKYPSTKRDISLIAGTGVSFEKIVSIVNEKGSYLIENVELFDKYSGKQIPAGHYGLSFRIEYRDRKKTITAEDVDKVHSEIRRSLVDTLRVTLR